MTFSSTCKTTTMKTQCRTLRTVMRWLNTLRFANPLTKRWNNPTKREVATEVAQEIRKMKRNNSDWTLRSFPTWTLTSRWHPNTLMNLTSTWSISSNKRPPCSYPETSLINKYWWKARFLAASKIPTCFQILTIWHNNLLKILIRY